MNLYIQIQKKLCLINQNTLAPEQVATFDPLDIIPPELNARQQNHNVKRYSNELESPAFQNPKLTSKTLP